MGFAVVAEEVRNLALRSADAAHETSERIASASSKTSHGVDLSRKVSESFREITSRVRQMVDVAAEVAKASARQMDGIRQMTAAVEVMQQVNRNTASNADGTAAAAEELNAQAQSVEGGVHELLELVDGRK